MSEARSRGNGGTLSCGMAKVSRNFGTADGSGCPGVAASVELILVSCRCETDGVRDNGRSIQLVGIREEWNRIEERKRNGVWGTEKGC